MGQVQNLSIITGFVDSSVVVTKYVQQEHCSAAEKLHIDSGPMQHGALSDGCCDKEVTVQFTPDLSRKSTMKNHPRWTFLYLFAMVLIVSFFAIPCAIIVKERNDKYICSLITGTIVVEETSIPSSIPSHHPSQYLSSVPSISPSKSFVPSYSPTVKPSFVPSLSRVPSNFPTTSTSPSYSLSTVRLSNIDLFVSKALYRRKVKFFNSTKYSKAPSDNPMLTMTPTDSPFEVSSQNILVNAHGHSNSCPMLHW